MLWKISRQNIVLDRSSKHDWFVVRNILEHIGTLFGSKITARASTDSPISRRAWLGLKFNVESCMITKCHNTCMLDFVAVMMRETAASEFYNVLQQTCAGPYIWSCVWFSSLIEPLKLVATARSMCTCDVLLIYCCNLKFCRSKKRLGSRDRSRDRSRERCIEIGSSMASVACSSIAE